MTPITLPGIIHGNTIEFSEPIALAEGQAVRVTIQPLAPSEKWGEGLKRCAGALADSWSDEDDRILREIYLNRKRPSSRKLPE
jgi:hypothetical protein